MNSHSYFCKCAVHPDGHLVRKAAKVSHLLEVQQFRQQSSLSQDFESLSLADKGPEDSNDDSSVLANLITGLTLTDEGPMITKQHSKLWSSSSEFHQSLIPKIPTTMNHIPMSDVQSSILAIIEEPLHTASPPQSAPEFNVFHHTATPTPSSLSANAWVKKAEGVVRAVETEVRAIGDSLSFSDGVLPTDDVLRTLLATAAKNVEYAGKSLASVKNQSAALLQHKTEVLTMLRSIDCRIIQLGSLLPPSPSEETPVVVETAHIYDSPVAKLDTIAQVMILLGAVCNIIIGLSSEPCDFILSVVTMIVKMAMATRLVNPSNGKPEYDTNQHTILEQLPTSLFTALSRFNIDGQTTVYAACPVCNFTHKPIYDPVSTYANFPAHCVNRIVGAHGTSVCGTSLLVARNGHLRPIKPYVVASFTDYLARSLADPEIERLSKQACDDAKANLHNPPDETTNIFSAAFMKSFGGPVPGQLFIDRGDKVRIAFAIHVDFFNPNGTKKRGNHDSIGIISLANLNLPESIRYLPENIFLAIIPGPREPNLEELNHYTRPIIDTLEIGWKRGFHISRTADCPDHGEDVEVAIVLSVNDLPAARKVSGMAGFGSHFYCTVCDGHGRSNIYNTEFEKWKPRDTVEMRKQAEAWRDADKLKTRRKIFDTYGIRWSEFWRLPYWDPTRMLVIDSMHCILEGIVHYHCRHVLALDAKEAGAATDPPQPAFSHPWTAYNSDIVPLEFRNFNDREIKHVAEIQKLLTLPLNLGPETIDQSQLLKRLCDKNFRPLKYIFSDLGIPSLIIREGRSTPAKTKNHFATLLVDWRLTKPMSSGDSIPKTCTPATLEYIQHVIKTTDTPSWINSVPHNYGEAGAGSIKADEWRILSTVYLPLALVTLWGDEDGTPPSEGSHFLKVLDHTMALFQAVTLVVRYTMNNKRATQYRNFIREWVEGLHTLHPHTMEHADRANVHASFHLYDFLLLFGPVISWWCFPFERLIGILQKITTNDMIGGPLEHTILRSHTRAANLRRWLKRPDCPEVIRRFKSLFDKVFSPSSQMTKMHVPTLAPREVAHYMYDGVNFSRSSTHLGNSLVLYYPSPSSVTPVAGSIEKIIVSTGGVHLSIRRQAALPPGHHDPFRRYPLFPATVYSSEMDDGPADRVTFESIISHVARFTFSLNRAVILNLSRV